MVRAYRSDHDSFLLMATIESLPLLDPQTIIGRGGFGELFADPRDNSRCIKVLKTPLTGPSAAGIIRLVNVLKWACPSDALTLTTRFAWPVEVFGAVDAVVGFTMPRSPASTRFSLTAGRRTSEQDLQAKYLMDDGYWRSAAISSPKPDFSTADRIEIFLDLAYSVMVLHRNGLSYGDISSNNIAIRAEETPGVFLFDADSIVPVKERAATPLVSPGWEVADTLDPLEIDRARMALFALRLFVEQPTASATPDALNTLEMSLSSGVAHTVANALDTGGDREFDELLKALRARRDPARARAAFDAAVDSRFAKWVIRESDHATYAADHRLVDEAVNQLLVEQAVASLAGQRRRSKITRDKLARSSFLLDIPPVISLPNPPKTEAALKELVYEAMFEEVASHLVSEGLGTLDSHSWTSRAVQRALVEGEDPQLQVTHSIGQASVRVWWPVDQFVNVAKLVISYPGGVSENELRRGDADSQMTRELTLPSGGNVQVEVTAGSVSPAGVTVWSDRSVSSDITVAPLPRPDRPVVSTLGGASTQSASVATVFDPEAERQRLLLERLQREQEEAEARQQRRRKRGLIAASVLAVLGIGGGATWWFLGDSARGTADIASYLERPFDDASALGYPKDVSNISVLINGDQIDLAWSPALTTTGAEPDQYRVIRTDLDSGASIQRIAGQRARFTFFDVPAGRYTVEIRPEWLGADSGNSVSTAEISITPSGRRAGELLPAGLRLGFDDNGLFVQSSERLPNSATEYRVVWAGPDRLLRGNVLINPGRTDLAADASGTWSVSIRVYSEGRQQVVQLPRVSIPVDHPSIRQPSTP